MKKFGLFLLIIILGIIYINKDTVVLYVVQNILYKGTNTLEINEYHKSDDFELVKNVVDLKPSSSNDFNNIVYTILNSGMDEVTIYCSNDYKNCADDFYNYTNETNKIETINNYVSPFNSFKNISISVDSFDRIKFEIEKAYSDEEIVLIDTYLNKFIEDNINSTMSNKDKIKIFHDYIINHTDYDSSYQINTDKNLYSGSPYNAYGVLFEQKGICGGYSDTMALYLDKLGIKNYKISSDEHVWNYVYIDDEWYHLDLTWDDPVTNTGEKVLIYDFFLINSKQLEKREKSQHTYDKTLYLEAQ